MALVNSTFDLAYISDLRRTIDTFNLINEQLKNKIQIKDFEPLLREKSGGVLEGKKLDVFA
jgi:broad specificity phosphatase PhoE